ncbi:hypothetical protein [Pseudomonas sp. S11P7]|uniref:hypothetical protein n=1 Tax=Pseudomonas sp. S11P7 TaxID=3029169 RepID=UPI00406D029A
MSWKPKLFSFNNPAGACLTCDGLGVKQFFDIKRLVNGELTLAEGAIRGWDRRKSTTSTSSGRWRFALKFSLDKPFNELTAEQQKKHPARQRFAERRLQIPPRPGRYRQAFAPVRRHRAESRSAATARQSRQAYAKSWPSSSATRLARIAAALACAVKRGTSGVGEKPCRP